MRGRLLSCYPLRATKTRHPTTTPIPPIATHLRIWGRRVAGAISPGRFPGTVMSFTEFGAGCPEICVCQWRCSAVFETLNSAAMSRNERVVSRAAPMASRAGWAQIVQVLPILVSSLLQLFLQRKYQIADGRWIPSPSHFPCILSFHPEFNCRNWVQRPGCFYNTRPGQMSHRRDLCVTLHPEEMDWPQTLRGRPLISN
jgi:hypothetical protein